MVFGSSTFLEPTIFDFIFFYCEQPLTSEDRRTRHVRGLRGRKGKRMGETHGKENSAFNIVTSSPGLRFDRIGFCNSLGFSAAHDRVTLDFSADHLSRMPTTQVWQPK